MAYLLKSNRLPSPHTHTHTRHQKLASVCTISSIYQWSFISLKVWTLTTGNGQQKILWCICDRASYMKMTRGTNLMQQFWFIIINISTCFGHLYAHLQVKKQKKYLSHSSGDWGAHGGRIQTYTQCTRLHTGSSGPQPQQLVLNTICSSIQPVLLKTGI